MKSVYIILVKTTSRIEIDATIKGNINLLQTDVVKTEIQFNEKSSTLVIELSNKKDFTFSFERLFLNSAMNPLTWKEFMENYMEKTLE